MRMSVFIWLAIIRDYLACFVSHTKVSDVRIMYSVWYWRDSHVELIVRLMHVPQIPGEGDAKGLRLPFQNG